MMTDSVLPSTEENLSPEILTLVARLLATENISVEHRAVKQASFDLGLRMLVLPNYQNVTKSVYTALVAHEVGHALFTPNDYARIASRVSKCRKINTMTFQGYLNILEDVRIERKIKSTYPGLRRDFTEAYGHFAKEDFFGLKGQDPNGLSFINRLNIYFKAGHVFIIRFNNDIERAFVKRLQIVDTFADLVQLVEEVYDYSREHEQKNRNITADLLEELAQFQKDELSDEGDNEENNYNGDEELSHEEDFTPDDDLPKGKKPREQSEDDKNDAVGRKDLSENDDEKADTDAKDAGEGGKENDNASEKQGSSKSSAVSKNSVSKRKAETNEETDASAPTTDSEFKKNVEGNLVNTSTTAAPNYVRMPKTVNLNDYIIGYKEMLSIFQNHNGTFNNQVFGSEDQSGHWTKDAFIQYARFRTKNNKVVSYLVQEFEARKSASQYSRARDAKTGVLNPIKLHSFKYAEDIFKRLTIIPEGKNHGLVMFIDLSGSMQKNIKGTVEQLLNLVLFCRRTNIPHRVYGFTTFTYGCTNKFQKELASKTSSLNRLEGEVGICPDFWLLEFFHEKMRTVEYATMAASLLKSYGGGCSMPRELRLNDTPLNETIFLARYIVPAFRKETNSEIVNTIFLTDGGATGIHHWVNYNLVNDYLLHQNNEASYILLDEATRHSMRFSSGYTYTEKLMKMLRAVCGIKTITFYIASSVRDIASWTNDTNQTQILEDYRTKKFAILNEAMGCNEVYLIAGAKDLEIGDTTLDSIVAGATMGEIRRAFQKLSLSRRMNRVVLSRFIDMIT